MCVTKIFLIMFKNFVQVLMFAAMIDLSSTGTQPLNFVKAGHYGLVHLSVPSAGTPSPRNLEKTSMNNGGVGRSIQSSFPHHTSAFVNTTGAIPFEMQHLLFQTYNDNKSAYHDPYTENSYLHEQPSADFQLQTPNIDPTNGGINSYPSLTDQNNNYDYYYNPLPYYYEGDWNKFHYNPAEPSSLHRTNAHSFTTADKLFSRKVLATKALKFGKIMFSFVIVMIVFFLAGVSKAGLAVSPVVLPISLVPVGLVALLIFIPLFMIIVPLSVGELEEMEKRRRRRSTIQYSKFKVPANIEERLLINLDDRFPKVLEKVAESEKYRKQ